MQWNQKNRHPHGLLLRIFVLCFVCILALTPYVFADAQTSIPKECYLGGMPFGVKLHTKGVFVVGVSKVDAEQGQQNPAYDAGIRQKDIILSVNQKDVNTVAEVTNAIAESNGAPIQFTVLRDNQTQTISVRPVRDREGQYRCGLWIRDHTAGIGTVTFILPQTKTFAGLGHGICDGDTGELMPLLRGTVSDVSITGIVKGSVGHPGELKGYFQGVKIGSLLGNTKEGVFGVLSDVDTTRPLVPIATAQEVHAGDATLFCTLQDGTIKGYSIQISKIKTGTSTKNFVVEVTDSALLEATGGIVQGMSGSPILQDGKLIGAVTHVLINDPQKGYGIFIENMLAQIPSLLAS